MHDDVRITLRCDFYKSEKWKRKKKKRKYARVFLSRFVAVGVTSLPLLLKAWSGWAGRKRRILPYQRSSLSGDGGRDPHGAHRGRTRCGQRWLVEWRHRGRVSSWTTDPVHGPSIDGAHLDGAWNGPPREDHLGHPRAGERVDGGRLALLHWTTGMENLGWWWWWWSWNFRCMVVGGIGPHASLAETMSNQQPL